MSDGVVVWRKAEPAFPLRRHPARCYRSGMIGLLLDWLLNRERREYLDRQNHLGLLLIACNDSSGADADPAALGSASPALSAWLSQNFSPDHRIERADV